jgi:hypothetical protein
LKNSRKTGTVRANDQGKGEIGGAPCKRANLERERRKTGTSKKKNNIAPKVETQLNNKAFVQPGV